MKTKLSIKSLITCLILCLSIGAQAKEIKPKQAQQAAMGFINQHFTTEILLPGIPNDLILNFIKEHVGTEVNNSPKILPLYYVFSFQSSNKSTILSCS